MKKLIYIMLSLCCFVLYSCVHEGRQLWHTLNRQGYISLEATACRHSRTAFRFVPSFRVPQKYMKGHCAVFSNN